jgi:2-polyprenyl-3-methyl-5-hydroxy-6-metoxy-1,4-benzoquinol methylase
VGCGDGAHYGRKLAAIAHEYHGLELAESAVSLARQYGIHAQQHDLGTTFPHIDLTFDVVICIDVLEHLFDPAFALSEMRRVTKPNGHIILSVPNIAHYSNRLRALLGGFAPGGTPETSSLRPWADPHIRFFTVSSLRRFISEQRLHLVELHGEGLSVFSTMPVLSKLASRFVGWQQLEHMSRPFEFLSRWYPPIFAGNLLAVTTPLMKHS